MNTLIDHPKSAAALNGQIVVLMESGIEIRFPIDKNPRLSSASLACLNNIELSPFGLHWPELDEDLSFRGLYEGRFGQEK
jgi:hypothetical protein